MTPDFPNPRAHFDAEVRIQVVLLEAARAARIFGTETGAVLPEAVRAEVEALTRAVDERAAATAGWLPIRHVCGVFELDDVDRGLLLALAAAELDPAFGRLLLASSGDPEGPRAGTVARLVAFALDRPVLSVLERLEPRAPLCDAGLVRWDAEEGLLAWRPIRIAEPVARCLAGERPALDHLVARFGHAVSELPALDSIVLPPAIAEACAILATRLRWKGPSVVQIQGPDMSGRVALGLALLGEAEAASAHVLDIPAQATLVEARGLFERALRDAACQACGLVLRLPDGDPIPGIGPVVEGVLRRLGPRMTAPVVIVRSEPIPSLYETDLPCYPVRLPRPSTELRRTLWERWLPPPVRDASLDLGDAARRFEFTSGQVLRATRQAMALASLAGPGPVKVRPVDVERASSAMVQEQLGALGEHVPASFDWDDLIVAGETQRRLLEIVAAARQRNKVLFGWGFGEKVPYGRGLMSLFSGPPGTGKTMAASIVARALGGELYRVDLSRVVSKWVGETEKHLSRIFDVASETGIILVFDEADSLFGKRTSQTSSATDRYANLEVNFLLQRVEHHEGVVILTTNAPSALDDAFRRRIRFHVAFAEPDLESRVRLWQGIIPAGCEIDDDVDWTLLASRFQLNGAGIKNAVLRAAVLAAEAGDRLSMTHLGEAALRECEDRGQAVRAMRSDE